MPRNSSIPSSGQTPLNAGVSAGQTASAAFLLVFLLILIPGRTQLLCDPGIYWHVVVGDRILSHRALIYTDSFSFTFGGQPWIAQQWLAECLMSVIHACAGLTGLVLVSAALIAVTFGGAAGRFRKSGLHILPTLIYVLLATAAVAGHAHARPHLATMVLMAFTITRLIDYEQERISMQRLWGLVPLYILWTNLHGGMLAGLVSVGMAVCGWTLFWRAGLKSPISRWSEVGQHIGLVTTLAATCLINPYGLKLPLTWIYLSQSDLTFIAEHAPLNPWTSIGQLTLVVAVSYGLVLCRLPRHSVEVSWLIPIPWFLMGILHIRHAPLFSITVLFVLAEAFPRSAWAGPLKNRGWLFPPLPRVRFPLSWLRQVAVLTIILFIGATVWHGWRSDELWAQPCADYWPDDVIPAIREFAAEQPEGTRIFNEMQYGGFLVYTAPKLQLFVDDRCELYREEFLRECLVGYRSPEKLRVWIQEYGIEAALVSRGSSFDLRLAEWPEWELIYTGKANLYHHR